METSWDLPGVQIWGEPDPTSPALLLELSDAIPLAPAAAEETNPEGWPDFTVGLSLQPGQVPHFHIFEKTSSELGSSANWPMGAAAVGHLLGSGLPAFDLGYLRTVGEGDEAPSRGAALFVGDCPGIFTDAEMFGFDPVAESEAFAAALARSGVLVPAPTIGYCDRYSA